MLVAITLWVLAGALVGYFGRHRALGFWGVFLFAVVFSPIIGALALLVFHSRGDRPVRRTVVKRAPVAGLIPSVPAEFRPAAAELLTAVSTIEVLTPRWLVITWCSIILVFAAVYWAFAAKYGTGQAHAQLDPVTTGLVQSLNVGSLGGATDPQDHVIVLVAAIERLSVLVLLLAFMARLVLDLRQHLVKGLASARISVPQPPSVPDMPLPKTRVSSSTNGG